MDIAAIRTDYTLKSLSETDTIEDAIEQFNLWFKEALDAQVTEPNAFTLATSIYDLPDARILLLKGIDDVGFQFFTNYSSTKGKQMATNPNGCMVFFWPELQRQVRIRGSIEKVSEDISNQYFLSRPKESQIGAHASKQSMIIGSREELEDNIEQMQNYFKTHELSRPEHWGGYRLIPTEVEFWQGRSSRLHDRIKYTKQGEVWNRIRLQP